MVLNNLGNEPVPSDSFQGYNNPTFTSDIDSYIPDILPPPVTRSKVNDNIEDNHYKLEILVSETKEYDPYDHCTSKKPTSYCDSLLHLLKASIGTGILAIPSAFKESGYGIGIGGILFVGILYTWCIHLLVAAEYELCKRKRVPHMTYANTVHTAFAEGPSSFRWLANAGKFFANFFFMIYESGGCAIYIIFISSNLKQLLDFYLQDDVNLRTIMVYVTIPMVFVCWVRNLKILAPLSAIANVITIVSFILVFWYVFREPPSFEGKSAVTGVAKMPVYMSTVLFATACTGIILPLKSEMSKPKQFGMATGILNMSMIPICILYGLFGFFGYLKYGDKVAGSITLNLPEDELLAQGIKGLYSLSVFISYFLCYYVVFDIVWKSYLKEKVVHKNRLVWEYVIRTFIPLFTFVLAYAIPNLEAFISLVGAFGISTTSLVIPVIVHTLVFWNSFESRVKFWFYATKNIILLVTSVGIFSTGVYESVSDVLKMHASK